MIFKKYRIKEDEEHDGVIHFLKEIYLKCQELNLTPQKVFMYIYDILNFSNEISISQIPRFLKIKTKEKEELEISIQSLNEKINEIENSQMEKEQEIQRLSEIAKKQANHHRLFSIAKIQIEQIWDKYGKFKRVCELRSWNSKGKL